jgi:hypothetical protein
MSIDWNFTGERPGNRTHYPSEQGHVPYVEDAVYYGIAPVMTATSGGRRIVGTPGMIQHPEFKPVRAAPVNVMGIRATMQAPTETAAFAGNRTRGWFCPNPAMISACTLYDFNESMPAVQKPNFL